MRASLFKDKVQLSIFCALVVSGLSLVVGLFTSYQKWLGLAAVLGPILGTIIVVIYFIRVSSAFFRNAAHEFWSDLCVLNLGLLVVGFVLFESKRGEVFLSMLPWASMLGLVLSWALYKSGAINSQYFLVIFQVLILMPSTFGAGLIWELFPSPYRPNVLAIPLTVGAVLIWIPIIVYATATSYSSRGESNGIVA